MVSIARAGFPDRKRVSLVARNSPLIRSFEACHVEGRLLDLQLSARDPMFRRSSDCRMLKIIFLARWRLNDFDRKSCVPWDLSFMIGLIACVFPYDICRALHHAEMHSCQILAHDTQRKHLRAGEDGDDRSQKRKTGHSATLHRNPPGCAPFDRLLCRSSVKDHSGYSPFASRIQPKFAAAPLHQTLTWCTRTPKIVKPKPTTLASCSGHTLKPVIKVKA